MILRREKESVLLITQPAHAWVSGQISRLWGNAEFETVCEDISLAAELHDVGFLSWDSSPQLNPETGLPYSFLEMPTPSHLGIWTQGVTHMGRYGRYPALLVSRHYSAIGEGALKTKAPEEQELISGFLSEQGAIQTALLTSLQNDHYYAPRCSDEEVKRDQQFVSLMDWISLQLCLGCREERLMRTHPAANNGGPFEVSPAGLEPDTVMLWPWPFREPTIRLLCEGRRLLLKFSEEAQMREAIQKAAPVTLTFTLRPAH